MSISKATDYPDNWTEIATAIKQAAGYRCSRCDRQCLPATNSYRHLDLPLRRALSAQVHHLDGNPSNNHPSNLVSLCAGCHLRMHRHHPQPTPGQLSLKLKLPANRHPRRSRQRRQLAFNDLIARLPRLAMTSSDEQLELNIK
jgi:5-methylcytosine-specific restriction endonuclease McrA